MSVTSDYQRSATQPSKISAFSRFPRKLSLNSVSCIKNAFYYNLKVASRTQGTVLPTLNNTRAMLTAAIVFFDNNSVRDGSHLRNRMRQAKC